MSGPLEGLVAIVTGGSQGLGLAIAGAFVESGASVLICGRDTGALDAAVAGLTASDDGRIASTRADVSVPADAERLVVEAIARFGQIDVLVNNAGIYGPKGNVEEVSWDDWEQAIRVNLFGSVLCARAVVPHFRARGRGKIIQLSGGGATAPQPGLSAYAASKAAVVRFAETLAVELAGTGVDVNAIAPGALNTRMLDEIIAAGPDAVGASFYAKALEQQHNGGVSFEIPARLAVYLASSASDGITGKLLSAVWDPWRTLAEHGDALTGSDVYTLRRIVPADRGLDWGDA